MAALTQFPNRGQIHLVTHLRLAHREPDFRLPFIFAAKNQPHAENVGTPLHNCNHFPNITVLEKCAEAAI